MRRCFEDLKLDTVFNLAAVIDMRPEAQRAEAKRKPSSSQVPDDAMTAVNSRAVQWLLEQKCATCPTAGSLSHAR